MDSISILQTAKDAALRAGAMIAAAQKDVRVSEKKASNNLVTQADLDAQKLIVSLIRSSFPDHLVFAEEEDEQMKGATRDPASEHLWVIDPIDGTNNYASGIPLYSVSIAYASRGEVLAGVVYDPSRNELFWAEKGKGAWCNGRKLSVSGAATLQEVMLSMGFYYDRGELMTRTLDKLRELLSLNIRGLLRIGSAAMDLAWGAAGRFDAFFEYLLSPWDYAAGMLLVAEAGGHTCDRYGNPLDLAGQKGVVAANAHVFAQFREIVKWRE
jgi:myo-inositol-1(or 4)-monophosphatase